MLYPSGTNAIHGLQNLECLADGRCPTSFPAPVSMSSTFNMSLVRDMGAVLGRELRAYYNNLSHNSLDTWSPTSLFSASCGVLHSAASALIPLPLSHNSQPQPRPALGPVCARMGLPECTKTSILSCPIVIPLLTQIPPTFPTETWRALARTR